MEVEETGNGASNDRPGLRRVMAAARRGRIGAVLVWRSIASVDRLDLHAHIRALADAGVRFEAATQGLRMDPLRNDPMAQLLSAVLSGMLPSSGTSSASARSSASPGALRRPRLRPPSRVALDGREIRALHRSGKTWRQIAQALGCTIPAARWAARKGVRKRRPQICVFDGGASQ